MLFTTKRKIIISLVLSFTLFAGVYLFFYYQQKVENGSLTSSFSGTDTLLDVTFSPSFPSHFEALNGKGILAVSTGDISKVKLHDKSSGETIAEASALEVLTKDSNGKTKELQLIVQILTSSSPQRNIMPWIIQKASELISVPGLGEIKSNEELRQLFPKGSRWIFVPFISSFPKENTESIPEYANYAERYYGKSNDPSVFIETNLRDLLRDPILLLDVFYFFGD